MPNADMTIRGFIESARWDGSRAPENMAYLIERLVGSPAIKQMQCNNGAYISSITEFMADNPGLVETMLDWIEENYSNDIEEEDVCHFCEEDRDCPEHGGNFEE